MRRYNEYENLCKFIKNLRKNVQNPTKDSNWRSPHFGESGARRAGVWKPLEAKIFQKFFNFKRKSIFVDFNLYQTDY